MAGDKGVFRRIADAVRGAVHTSADGAPAPGPGSDGAGTVADSNTQPKSARKAARKATIARAEDARQKSTDAARAARRRRG